MIGLYFGSFNPIHWGHVLLANFVRTQQKLPAVIFIPSPLSPFKPPTHYLTKKSLKPTQPRTKLNAPQPSNASGKLATTEKKAILTQFDHRIQLLDLALAGWEGLRYSTIERTLPLPSYTYQTLKQLRRQDARYKKAFLIVGEDQLPAITHWQESTWILTHYPLLVYRRNVAEALAPALSLQEKYPHIELRVMTGAPLLAFSSSLIRARLKKHQSIAHLVPPAVYAYIKKHKLFV